MATAVLKEQLQATRGEVYRACELLTSPSAESLDRCSQILEMAGEHDDNWTFFRHAVKGLVDNDAVQDEARELL